MSYEKQIWQNLPSEETPIIAQRLNHMEEGIDIELLASEEGNDITLQNTTELPYRKFNIDGNSVQEEEPTPEAPVEIQSVGDDVNELNPIEGGSQGISSSVFDGKISFSGIANSTFANITGTTIGLIKEGTKTFSINEAKPYSVRLRLYYTESEYIDAIIPENKKEVTVELTNDVIKYYTYIYPLTVGTNYNDFIYEKLQKGTVATAYSEYGKGTVEIKQNNEDGSIETSNVLQLSKPLRSLPNGTRDTREADGTHRRIGAYTFTGEESGVSLRGTYNGLNVFQILEPFNYKLEKADIANAMCDYFKCEKPLSYVADNTIVEGIQLYYNSGNTSRALYINTNKFTTVEELKTFLAENPVTVQYELAEEVIEPYTEEEQAEYDNLINTGTYKGITHIYSTNEVNPLLDVEGYTENEMNNVFAKIEEIEKIQIVSNDNGTATKFPDGTMICRYTIPKEKFLNKDNNYTSIQNINVYRSGVFHWIYPVAFINTNIQLNAGIRNSVTGTRFSIPRFHIPNEISAEIQLLGLESFTETGEAYTNLEEVYVTAIGKWK